MVPITIVFMGFIKKVITGGHHLVENGSERTWDPLQGCASPVISWFINYTGWWFGTFGLFSIYWNVIIPSDELIFFRGVGLNHQPV